MLWGTLPNLYRSASESHYLCHFFCSRISLFARFLSFLFVIISQVLPSFLLLSSTPKHGEPKPILHHFWFQNGKKKVKKMEKFQWFRKIRVMSWNEEKVGGYTYNLFIAAHPIAISTSLWRLLDCKVLLLCLLLLKGFPKKRTGNMWFIPTTEHRLVRRATVETCVLVRLFSSASLSTK